MTPTIGRIVHFVQQHSPERVPAVICYVHPLGALRSISDRDGTLLNLGLWDPLGNPTPGVEGAPEDQNAVRPNSWHWPKREETQGEIQRIEVTAAPVIWEQRLTQLEAIVKELGTSVEGLEQLNDDCEPEDEDDDSPGSQMVDKPKNKK